MGHFSENRGGFKGRMLFKRLEAPSKNFRLYSEVNFQKLTQDLTILQFYNRFFCSVRGLALPRNLNVIHFELPKFVA